MIYLIQKDVSVLDETGNSVIGILTNSLVSTAYHKEIEIFGNIPRISNLMAQAGFS